MKGLLENISLNLHLSARQVAIMARQSGGVRKPARFHGSRSAATGLLGHCTLLSDEDTAISMLRPPDVWELCMSYA